MDECARGGTRIHYFHGIFDVENLFFSAKVEIFQAEIWRFRGVDSRETLNSSTAMMIEYLITILNPVQYCNNM